MELSDIEMDTSRSNNEIVYENLKIAAESSAPESQSKKVEEEHYETLKFGDSHKRKVESGDDVTVKRLKYVIYVLIVLISVVYITLVTLVIVLFVPKEPVDGRWAQWSSWTSCDVTCGNGTQLRTRTCTNPVPANKGSYCIGESLQSSECTKDNCPVDGQWSHWSSWTSCDVTCGRGTHLRSRTCTNPVPNYKGMDCTGENLQSAECSEGSCQVDGQWAEWSIWSSCDVTCGNGTHRRTRTCTKAVHTDKGVGCTGESLQISDCSKSICPVDGQWAHWSSWTSCDVTCGRGTRLRSRTCTNPVPANNGLACTGDNLQTAECSKVNCLVDGHWAQWSSWTSCDVTCGNGKHLRLRTCTNPVPMNNGNDCIGDSLQSGECSKDNCPVNGQWAHWSSWTSCDVTCGKGTRQRSRTCTNPVPANNGLSCTGGKTQTAECSKDSCPVDGQWAFWSSWASCDVTCGKGRQLRTRRCTNPMPENKGKDCIGESLQSSQCSVVNCSVDGQWAYWSSWTSCDVTCGTGRQLRMRRCSNPLPENGGTDCIGESFQNSQCSQVNCSVDGQWANWSSWTSCDVTCGKGRQLRTRRCTNPIPENKGKDCIGESLQMSQCLAVNCPAIMSAFSVTRPSSYTSINGIYKLTFTSTIYQFGNDFSISTGTYTCRISGVYHFSATLVKLRSSSRVDMVYCKLFKNRQSLINIKLDPTDDATDKGHAAISQSIVINLNVGDTVFLSDCSNPPSTFMEHWTSFTGFLLYHTN